jgi:hypothetical protein
VTGKPSQRIEAAGVDDADDADADKDDAGAKLIMC